MYVIKVTFAILALLIVSTSVNAEGENADLLEKALKAAAMGDCPEEILSPMLRGTCEQQMPSMGQNLSQRGSINNIEYMGIQHTQMGPAEVYRVNYAQSSLMWLISVGPDGKLTILWSPG